MNYNNKFTLLNFDQIFGENRIEVLNKIGTKSPMTDFAVALGASFNSSFINMDNYLEQAGWYFLNEMSNIKEIYAVSNADGRSFRVPSGVRSGGIRPVISFNDISELSPSIQRKNGIFEIAYGVYPQYTASISLSKKLDKLHLLRILAKTGKKYTTDSRNWNDYNLPFKATMYEEYEYNGKKYIRAIYENNHSSFLSNGKKYKKGDHIWLEVSPIIWYVSQKEKLLVSKNIVISGIRFCDNNTYDGNLENTEIYQFMNTIFAKDIIPSDILELIEPNNKTSKKDNTLEYISANDTTLTLKRKK